VIDGLIAMQQPTAKYVRDRLRESEGKDVYFRADPAVAAVFKACEGNRDDACVLAKVAVLNALYSTRIMNIYPVVNRILELDADDRLRDGDETLVGDIARVKLGTRVRTLLSFASKYCAWHEPEMFQIFDSRVEAMLWTYRQRFGFAKFKRPELRDYPTFARLISEFRAFFGLADFTRKQIDKFLWIEGGR
jgi:hypothetical protein